MKKQNLFLFPFYFLSFSLLLISCKRINEATELGGDLIPAIDNINTFEKFFPVETYNHLYNDTGRVVSNDQFALGQLNDPDFGQTKSDIYFNVGAAVPMVNPFYHKDSVQGIDSVVLSLSYVGSYGDTNSLQTVEVLEIAQNSDFSDTSLYKRNHPAFATGASLGSKTFSISQLNDTIRLIRKTDTTKVVNVLRIPLSNSLGERFKTFDTTNSANGGFRNDSIFNKLFKGLAVISQSATGTGSLAYFSIVDPAKTKVTVYFRVQRNGKIDTTSADFAHVKNGQANLINRTPAGGYQTYLANGAAEDDKVFIQSTPGSYAAVKLKGVDTMSNKIIHRAELIAYRLPSAQEAQLPPPSLLYVDRKRGTSDSVYFLKDLFDAQGGPNVAFGGSLRGDNTYRFTLTRHVQEIILGVDTNDSLRLFAPLQLVYPIRNSNQFFPIPVNSLAANGRVVLAGGNYSDPALRMRLRIIYSNIK